MAVYVFTSNRWPGLDHTPRIDADAYGEAIVLFLRACEVPDSVIADCRVYDQPDDILPRDCTLVWRNVDGERQLVCGFTIPLPIKDS